MVVVVVVVVVVLLLLLMKMAMGTGVVVWRKKTKLTIPVFMIVALTTTTTMIRLLLLLLLLLTMKTTTIATHDVRSSDEKGVDDVKDFLLSEVGVVQQRHQQTSVLRPRAVHTFLTHRLHRRFPHLSPLPPETAGACCMSLDKVSSNNDVPEQCPRLVVPLDSDVSGQDVPGPWCLRTLISLDKVGQTLMVLDTVSQDLDVPGQDVPRPWCLRTLMSLDRTPQDLGPWCPGSRGPWTGYPKTLVS